MAEVEIEILYKLGACGDLMREAAKTDAPDRAAAQRLFAGLGEQLQEQLSRATNIWKKEISVQVVPVQDALLKANTEVFIIQVGSSSFDFFSSSWYPGLNGLIEHTVDDHFSGMNPSMSRPAFSIRSQVSDGVSVSTFPARDLGRTR